MEDLRDLNQGLNNVSAGGAAWLKPGIPALSDPSPHRLG